MKAAGLKDISTVLESTAVLIRSNKASDEELIGRITRRIKGLISKLSVIATGLPVILMGYRCPKLCALSIQHQQG
jgi:ATP phosphoribosyltransferase